MPEALADVSVGQVAIWLGLIGLVVGTVRKAWPWLARLKDFFDDMMGEPARPGVPARPGAMARLATNEAATQDAAVAASQAATDAKTAATALHEIRALVRSAEYNSKPNGGRSAHDALMSQIVGLRDDLAAHVEQAKSIQEEQAAAIAYLADHGEHPGT